MRIEILVTCDCPGERWGYKSGQIVDAQEMPAERLDYLFRHNLARELPPPKPRAVASTQDQPPAARAVKSRARRR